MATDSARSTERAARKAPHLWPLMPWAAVVALLTVGLVPLRESFDKAHIALAYLLVVLVGSSRLGRRAGVTLGLLSFLSFNYFLLPPYYTLVLADPLDWLVLLALLVTSLVAAELFHRAQAEATAAQERAHEIDRLAMLGAEALGAARAEDAVQAVTRVVQSTLGVDACEIWEVRDPPGAFRRIAEARDQPSGDAGDTGAEGLFRYVVEQRATALERVDGTSRVVSAGEVHAADRFIAPEGTRSVVVPLVVADRAVGILRLTHERGIRLDEPQRRLADALSHYAALGVERARLAAEAERAEVLREADRLKDALIASVSHDLRTPLTTIKALAHELRASGDERAEMIETEADRLNRLVADLLDLSRLNAGELRLDVRIIPADDLIGAALDQLARAPRAEDVHPRLEGEGPHVGRFDFVHCLRALVNLIENALKYSPPGSEVEVVATREGGHLVVSVLDRGPGVPAEEADRVFEPFYRGVAATPDVGGAGLGLAIARRLVEAQGGTLRYAARSGGGSVFSIRLPAVDPVELAGLGSQDRS